MSLVADPDPNVQLTAAGCPGHFNRYLDPAPEASVATLRRLLNDPSPQVRAAAAKALAELKP